MTEVWKDIVGKEGRYAVSNMGRVKSLARTDSKGQPWPERILRPYLTGKSSAQYPTVQIDKRNEKVHRLVALAFLSFNLGRLLREWRGKRHQREVALHLGIQRPSYTNLESGSRGLTLVAALKLVSLYDLALEDLKRLGALYE